MKNVLRSLVSSAVLAVLAAGSAFGQEETRTEKSTTEVRKDGHAAGGHSVMGVAGPRETDSRIVSWVGIGNHCELEMSKLAQSKAGNESVKQFANKMVDDHQHFAEELKAFMHEGHDMHSGRGGHKTENGHSGTALIRRDTKENIEKAAAADPAHTATVVNDDGRSRDGGLMHRDVNFLAVKREVAHKVAPIMVASFEKMSAKEFDHAFMGWQVMNHEEMLATLEVVHGYASKDLQAALDRGIETTRNHLKMAKEIKEQLRGEQEKHTSTDSSK